MTPLIPTAGSLFDAVTHTMAHAVLVHATALPGLLEPGAFTPPRALDQVLCLPFTASPRMRTEIIADFLRMASRSLAPAERPASDEFGLGLPRFLEERIIDAMAAIPEGVRAFLREIHADPENERAQDGLIDELVTAGLMTYSDDQRSHRDLIDASKNPQRKFEIERKLHGRMERTLAHSGEGLAVEPYSVWEKGFLIGPAPG